MMRARWASSWSSQARVWGSVVMRGSVLRGTDTPLPPGPEPVDGGTPVDGGSRASAPAVVPARLGPALALVHRLHAGHRDGVPLGDQVGRELLRRRQQRGPRIGAAEQLR